MRYPPESQQFNMSVGAFTTSHLNMEIMGQFDAQKKRSPQEPLVNAPSKNQQGNLKLVVHQQFSGWTVIYEPEHPLVNY